MIWPFGNSEERKQKKRMKQAKVLFEDALDAVEVQAYEKAIDLLEQAKELGHSEAEAKIAEIRHRKTQVIDGTAAAVSHGGSPFVILE